MPDTDGGRDEAGTGAGAAPPAPGTAATPEPAPEEGGTRRRFVVSQMLNGYRDDRMRRDMIDVFNLRLERALLPNVDVLSDTGAAVAGLRRVLVVEADPAELAAKRRDLTADALIEREVSRTPCLFSPASAFTPLAPVGPGTGGSLRLLVRQGGGGPPVPGAKVVIQFFGRDDRSRSTQAGSYTGADGTASIPFDANLWSPGLAVVDAGSDFWARLVGDPQNGLAVDLERLPAEGPFGWWHYLTGAAAYEAEAGQGLSIGVVDTGVGPHRYLDHVVVLGCQIDGVFTPGAEAGRDIEGHGTHVAGLIGARPADGSGGYGGLAPGASLSAIRIFAPNRNANQADIMAAVDRLHYEQKVDLINLSLGGEEPSNLERDVFISALRAGTLCIAAAGNGRGDAIVYPAAYPECAAVSALGLANTYPADSLPAANLPTGAAGWGIGGIFSPAFTNRGPGLACASPGNAIISTVPAAAPDQVPYAAMSGTSMAAPLATGALAVSLSRDEVYRRLARTADRSAYAYGKLLANTVDVGLARDDVGFGLGREG